MLFHRLTVDQNVRFGLKCDAVFVERDPCKGISRDPTYGDQDLFFTVRPET